MVSQRLAGPAGCRAKITIFSTLAYYYSDESPFNLGTFAPEHPSMLVFATGHYLMLLLLLDTL